MEMFCKLYSRTFNSIILNYFTMINYSIHRNRKLLKKLHFIYIFIYDFVNLKVILPIFSENLKFLQNSFVFLLFLVKIYVVEKLSMIEIMGNQCFLCYVLLFFLRPSTFLECVFAII